jgi:hypothetical protein
MGQKGGPFENELYLIDFGLSKSFIDQDTKLHIKETLNTESNHSVSNPRFSSFNQM